MANQAHLSLLNEGVETWNHWREQNPSVHIDLQGADLAHADLRSANFGRADLRQTNLTGADLTNAILNDAQFSDAKVVDANLTCAILWGANFWHADFSRATLLDADLWRAVLINANLSQVNLHRANLTTAVLVDSNLREANLSSATVYGVAAWNVALDGAIQTDLIITQPHEPRITVDDLEIAQFIYLLLNHQRLRNVINAVTARGVLILGRFGGTGISTLHAIASSLREIEYLPIIFDFERPTSRDYTETVKTLVGLSRLVIVDLSGRSVPQELYASVPFFDVPVVPIIARGEPPYSMFTDLLKYPWVVRPPIEFASTEHLQELIPMMVAAAEDRQRAKRRVP
jgi:hypothetical protein